MLLRSVLSFNSEKNTWQVRRERRELGVDMMNKGYFVTISYGKIVTNLFQHVIPSSV